MIKGFECDYRFVVCESHWSLLLLRRKAIEEEIRVGGRREGVFALRQQTLSRERTDSTKLVIKIFFQFTVTNL